MRASSSAEAPCYPARFVAALHRPAGPGTGSGTAVSVLAATRAGDGTVAAAALERLFASCPAATSADLLFAHTAEFGAAVVVVPPPRPGGLPSPDGSPQASAPRLGSLNDDTPPASDAAPLWCVVGRVAPTVLLVAALPTGPRLPQLVSGFVAFAARVYADELKAHGFLTQAGAERGWEGPVPGPSAAVLGPLEALATDPRLMRSGTAGYTLPLAGPLLRRSAHVSPEGAVTVPDVDTPVATNGALPAALQAIIDAAAQRQGQRSDLRGTASGGGGGGSVGDHSIAQVLSCFGPTKLHVLLSLAVAGRTHVVFVSRNTATASHCVVGLLGLLWPMQWPAHAVYPLATPELAAALVRGASVAVCGAESAALPRLVVAGRQAAAPLWIADCDSGAVGAASPLVGHGARGSSDPRAAPLLPSFDGALREVLRKAAPPPHPAAAPVLPLPHKVQVEVLDAVREYYAHAMLFGRYRARVRDLEDSTGHATPDSAAGILLGCTTPSAAPSAASARLGSAAAASPVVRGVAAALLDYEGTLLQAAKNIAAHTVRHHPAAPLVASIAAKAPDLFPEFAMVYGDVEAEVREEASGGLWGLVSKAKVKAKAAVAAVAGANAAIGPPVFFVPPPVLSHRRRGDGSAFEGGEGGSSSSVMLATAPQATACLGHVAATLSVAAAAAARYALSGGHVDWGAVGPHTQAAMEHFITGHHVAAKPQPVGASENVPPPGRVPLDLLCSFEGYHPLMECPHGVAPSAGGTPPAAPLLAPRPVSPAPVVQAPVHRPSPPAVAAAGTPRALPQGHAVPLAPSDTAPQAATPSPPTAQPPDLSGDREAQRRAVLDLSHLMVSSGPPRPQPALLPTVVATPAPTPRPKPSLASLDQFF